MRLNLLKFIQIQSLFTQYMLINPISLLGRRDSIYQSSFAVLALSIGFGFSPLISIGFYVVAVICDPNHLKRTLKALPKTKTFIALLIIFFLTYWLGYTPTSYRRHNIELTSEFQMGSWLQLLWWICISIIPIIGLKDINQKIQFLRFELIGCSLWGSAIVLFSILNYQPPYYGNLHHPIFGFGLNSSGAANLISMAPVLFYSYLLCKTQHKKNLWGTFLALLFASSIWEATFLQQRTFFIVSFILCPLILFLFLMKNKNKYLYYLPIIGLIPLLYFSNKKNLEGNFEPYRKLTSNITNDLRFRLYENWLEQFLVTPFSRIRVTLIENPEHGIPTAEFHNFFMDVSRFSGSGALILALILFLYIIFKLVQRLKTNAPLGQLLIFLFIPLFLILCSAVFPEGELQFFLIILSIAAVNESAGIESKVEA